MNRPDLPAIFLNDHQAGSVGGVETARRARGSIRTTSSPSPWRGRSEADFAGLVARAEEQREIVQDLQLRAARLL